MSINNTNSTDIEIAKYNDITIYHSDIELLEVQYIDTLINPDDIYKTNVFSGLLNYLYINLFSNIVINNTGYKNTGYDYIALDNIFTKCYLPLVYKYSKTPTLQSFCCMVGISNSYLTEIMSGSYNDGSRVNIKTTETVKKWKSICESALVSKAFDDNGIGAIFGLKAAHGWSDSQVQQIQLTTGNENSTPEQLSQKYGSIEKPAIDVID